MQWNSTFNIIKCVLYLIAIINTFIEKEQQDWEAYYNQAIKNSTKPYLKKGKKKPLIINNALGKKG